MYQDTVSLHRMQFGTGPMTASEIRRTNVSGWDRSQHAAPRAALRVRVAGACESPLFHPAPDEKRMVTSVAPEDTYTRCAKIQFGADLFAPLRCDGVEGAISPALHTSGGWIIRDIVDARMDGVLALAMNPCSVGKTETLNDVPSTCYNSTSELIAIREYVETICIGRQVCTLLSENEHMNIAAFIQRIGLSDTGVGPCKAARFSLGMQVRYTCSRATNTHELEHAPKEYDPQGANGVPRRDCFLEGGGLRINAT